MKTNTGNTGKTESNDSKKKPGNKTGKQSSALAAAAQGRSAVEKVKPASGADTNGKGKLANTGTNVSYEEN